MCSEAAAAVTRNHAESSTGDSSLVSLAPSGIDWLSFCLLVICGDFFVPLIDGSGSILSLPVFFFSPLAFCLDTPGAVLLEALKASLLFFSSLLLSLPAYVLNF